MTEILDAPVPGAVVAAPVEVTTADVLVRAADLLEEFGWCQYAPARDADGRSCLPQDSYARSFCMTGAAERAVLDLTGHDMRRNGPLPGLSITNRRPERHNGDASLSPAWNNAAGRTKAEVVAYLRTAATRAREGASK